MKKKEPMKKTFVGVVVSQKMQNTAVVEIVRKTPHPLYRKLIKRSKRYKVDTADSKVLVGDTVEIVETHPISKYKFFKIGKVLVSTKEKNDTA